MSLDAAKEVKRIEARVTSMVYDQNGAVRTDTFLGKEMDKFVKAELEGKGLTDDQIKDAKAAKLKEMVSKATNPVVAAINKNNKEVEAAGDAAITMAIGAVDSDMSGIWGWIKGLPFVKAITQTVGRWINGIGSEPDKPNPNELTPAQVDQIAMNGLANELGPNGKPLAVADKLKFQDEFAKSAPVVAPQKISAADIKKDLQATLETLARDGGLSDEQKKALATTLEKTVDDAAKGKKTEVDVYKAATQVFKDAAKDNECLNHALVGMVDKNKNGEIDPTEMLQPTAGAGRRPASAAPVVAP